jgi:nicotinate-nucleotide adenylyltransferase
MRVGVFGGTFDPVHLGHLILAEQGREQGQLDQVWFVPAPRPPHKPSATITRFEHRVDMLQLAIAGNPAFRVEPIEKDRQGPSYTADTLADLQRLHPEAEFFLLVGSDTLAELSTWYQPERVLQLATLLVMDRPGCPLITGEQLRSQLQTTTEVPIRVQVVESPLLISISSTELRLRAAQGRSVRYLVPRAVECYLHEKKLYQGLR